MAERDDDSPVSDKEKLEKLISSEGLDQLLLVVRSKGWAALLCCFAILIITLLWSFFGSIPVTATGIGITMTEKGPYLVISQAEGTVSKIYVAPGQIIEEGAIIARLENPVFALNIQTKKNQIAAKEAAIQALEATAQNGQQKLELETAIEGQRESLNNLKAELVLLEIENSYLEVHADEGGRILELAVATGDRLVPGTQIALLETLLEKGEKRQFFATFPAQYGNSIKVDMPVQIELSGVDPKHYGFLLGKIKAVSDYPVSKTDLQSIVKNSEIAAFLRGKEGLVYSATVELESDPKTVSGYRWTTLGGPPWKITSGETGTVRAVIERNPPIVYVLPIKASTHIQKTSPKG